MGQQVRSSANKTPGTYSTSIDMIKKKGVYAMPILEKVLQKGSPMEETVVPGYSEGLLEQSNKSLATVGSKSVMSFCSNMSQILVIVIDLSLHKS